MDLPPVEELIDYVQELEGKVFDQEMTNNKENIYKSILEDILTSCYDMEENKLLSERYPELYKKIDAEKLVSNLKDYIMEMNRINSLGI
jgi:hypothetical protein